MRSRWFATAALPLVLGAALGAQDYRVSGSVHDVATERPIQGAIVTVGMGANARSTQTDQTGAFALQVSDSGAQPINVRRLGYEPVQASIHVPRESQGLRVDLQRIATLDTVRVHAARQGIFGVVAEWGEDMRPLPGATVHILGESMRRVPVDSTARFFVPIKTPGTYVVRARANGYAPTTVSVTVRPNEGTEVAMLLDSASGKSNVPLEVAYDDLRVRLLRKTNASAMIPREELGNDPRPRLVDVIMASPSFAKRALRFTDAACVYVDGRARAGLSLNAIDPAAVEFVEVYGPGGDRSGMLARGWPRGFYPCADSGVPRAMPGRDVVSWVVIWTRR